MEFTGEGLSSLTMDDRFTMANMAIEAGAKNGIFEVDDKTIEYMKEHSKKEYTIYKADEDAHYDEVIEIDLDKIDYTVAFPHSPGNAKNKEDWGDISGDPGRDAARAQWGGKWRLPTKSEFQELIVNSTWTWTTQNGHSGYLVTSDKNGQTIFLPAAGWRLGNESGYVGSYGSYWSSSPGEEYAFDACGLFFFEGYRNVSLDSRRYGRSMRPVLGE